MFHAMKTLYRTFAISILLSLALGAIGEPLEFHVRTPRGAYSGEEDVRAVVYLSKSEDEPRFGPNWFAPEPCYSAKFVQARAGADLVVSEANATGFPGKLAALEPGVYKVQAVVDRDLGGRAIGDSPGNFYSTTVSLNLNPASSGAIDLTCDNKVDPPNVADTANVKVVHIQSKLLSNFYRRPTSMYASVALPAGYDQKPSAKKYPVLYVVPGFGGGYENSRGLQSEAPKDPPFIVVMLDPNCPTGHSVFADSENNGPWGRALTTELIPAIEHRFRIDARPQARFVTGHSSGGWSSLWLQITYPDFFGGVWSTSPDPVDFRDFQRIDIYAKGENMFTDHEGKPRPLAREGDRVLAWYKTFSDMERPIRGEQLGSFEAVFSPRGPDGQPMKLWNRQTGAISPTVAEAWRKYDIDSILRAKWKTLGPKLRGKLHIFTGNEDTFYLEGAVKLLKKDLASLGSDAEVEILPGNHMTVMTQSLRNHMKAEMARAYKESVGFARNYTRIAMTFN